MEDIKFLELIFNNVLQLSAGVAAILATALILRRVFANYGGEGAVIRSMKEELERLAATNVKLSTVTTDLQEEVRSLRTENATLHGEIAALRSENAQLAREVFRLNEQIDKLEDKCVKCKFRPAEDAV